MKIFLLIFSYFIFYCRLYINKCYISHPRENNDILNFRFKTNQINLNISPNPFVYSTIKIKTPPANFPVLKIEKLKDKHKKFKLTDDNLNNKTIYKNLLEPKHIIYKKEFHLPLIYSECNEKGVNMIYENINLNDNKNNSFRPVRLYMNTTDLSIYISKTELLFCINLQQIINYYLDPLNSSCFFVLTSENKFKFCELECINEYLCSSSSWIKDIDSFRNECSNKNNTIKSKTIYDTSYQNNFFNCSIEKNNQLSNSINNFNKELKSILKQENINLEIINKYKNLSEDLYHDVIKCEKNIKLKKLIKDFKSNIEKLENLKNDFTLKPYKMYKEKDNIQNLLKRIKNNI